jgi:hypothetical protein
VTLSQLKPTQRDALIELVVHRSMHRTAVAGEAFAMYRPTTPGIHANHSVRAVTALVRAQLAAWVAGSESEVEPTAEGRALVAEAAAQSPIARNLAA